MKWQIELRPEAMADLDEAAAWYAEKNIELGQDFVRQIIAAISGLALAPLTPRLRHRSAGIRWIYPRRFLYRIIYRVENEKVVILAILHAARSDAIWHRRK